jgi:hypothetical protein
MISVTWVSYHNCWSVLVSSIHAICPYISGRVHVARILQTLIVSRLVKDFPNLHGTLKLVGPTLTNCEHLIKQFPLSSCHFSHLRSKYPLQYPVFKHPQSVFFLLFQTPKFHTQQSSRLNYSIGKQIVNWVKARIVCECNLDLLLSVWPAFWWHEYMLSMFLLASSSTILHKCHDLVLVILSLKRIFKQFWWGKQRRM